MQLRFHRSDWQPLNQSDDYSFGPSQTSYADWAKITAQVSGNTVWGTAPEGNDPTDPPRTPSPTARAGRKAPVSSPGAPRERSRRGR